MNSMSKKLLQAAALTAVLVPLGSIAVETASINCLSQGSGSCNGSYSSGGGPQSNVWKFYSDSGFTDLLYTFEIAGTPNGSFTLNVQDAVVTNAFLVSSGALVNFPGYTCIPTFDATQCGLFDVFGGQNASWVGDGTYTVAITWFAEDDPDVQRPPDDDNNTILQAKDANGGFVFGNELAEIAYEPFLDPIDPGLAGRADGFSRFGGFRGPAAPVPEPGTLALLGAGVAGLISRARMRRKRIS